MCHIKLIHRPRRFFYFIITGEWFLLNRRYSGSDSEKGELVAERSSLRTFKVAGIIPPFCFIAGVSCVILWEVILISPQSLFVMRCLCRRDSRKAWQCHQ